MDKQKKLILFVIIGCSNSCIYLFIYLFIFECDNNQQHTSLSVQFAMKIRHQRHLSLKQRWRHPQESQPVGSHRLLMSPATKKKKNTKMKKTNRQTNAIILSARWQWGAAMSAAGSFPQRVGRRDKLTEFSHRKMGPYRPGVRLLSSPDESLRWGDVEVGGGRDGDYPSPFSEVAQKRLSGAALIEFVPNWLPQQNIPPSDGARACEETCQWMRLNWGDKDAASKG